jgi:hypothetical protein
MSKSDYQTSHSHTNLIANEFVTITHHDSAIACGLPIVKEIWRVDHMIRGARLDDRNVQGYCLCFVGMNAEPSELLSSILRVSQAFATFPEIVG